LTRAISKLCVAMATGLSGESCGLTSVRMKEGNRGTDDGLMGRQMYSTEYVLVVTQ